MLDDGSLKANCREKILNGFTVDQMVQKFENDFSKMVENGTTINRLSIVNKDLYKQLIVMYNQLDIRNYFPQNFDEENESGIDKKAVRRFRMRKLKERLWRNPLWRGFIKFLQKTGIMNKLKKSKLKTIIKKIFRV